VRGGGGRGKGEVGTGVEGRKEWGGMGNMRHWL